MKSQLELAKFAGRWNLQRQIEDFRSNTVGAFNGIAEFSTNEADLAYHETGQLQMAGQAPMTAERRYTWAQSGSLIEVMFSDGRLFHAFDPNQVRPKAAHFCDPDQYDATYDFEDWPIWRCVWDVAGPRKSYRMISTYNPV